VDAEFYGVDAEVGAPIVASLHVDGVLTYVHGRRLDTADDLYRIPPLTTSLALSWREETWSVSVESVLVDRQRKVSDGNSEMQTAGYGLWNLHGRWRPTEEVTLMAGVDNLLNRKYDEHLSGINRVGDSDVPVGDRIPGPGIGFYAGMEVRF
jgi:iron complex outermembrane receptor protein